MRSNLIDNSSVGWSCNISAEDEDPPTPLHNKCHGYGTNNLMVRLQSWNFDEMSSIPLLPLVCGGSNLIDNSSVGWSCNISAEDEDTPQHNKCHGCGTNNLMVRLQSWNFDEMWSIPSLPLICGGSNLIDNSSVGWSCNISAEDEDPHPNTTSVMGMAQTT